MLLIKFCMTFCRMFSYFIRTSFSSSYRDVCACILLPLRKALNMSCYCLCFNIYLCYFKFVLSLSICGVIWNTIPCLNKCRYMYGIPDFVTSNFIFHIFVYCYILISATTLISHDTVPGLLD